MKRKTRVFTWELTRKLTLIEKIRLFVESVYISMNMPKKKAG